MATLLLMAHFQARFFRLPGDFLGVNHTIFCSTVHQDISSYCDDKKVPLSLPKREPEDRKAASLSLGHWNKATDRQAKLPCWAVPWLT